MVECIDEGDTILHIVQGAAPVIGEQLRGRVDWPRRLDHLQQHTGQHILSQAFITLFNDPTHSFRMMDQLCEIDLELTEPSSERIERAVELAHNVIWEDRAIAVRQVTAEEAAKLPLRKESGRDGELRLIEIEGFDLMRGTMLTTQVRGILAVRSWERAKGLTRIVFVAGHRALEDYRRANKSALEVAALFSAGRDDTPPLVRRLIDDNKELHRHVRALEEIAARVEAEELLATAPSLETGLRLIAKTFTGRDVESLKQLAHALISNAHVVALLGSQDKEIARLVFARAGDETADMNALMKDACLLLEGRGGGRPDLAQGGGHKIEKLEEAISAAAASITAAGV